MARLQRGENLKIDHINDLVAIVKGSNSSDDCYKEALSELLTMFKPMLIKTCDKWSKYFNDTEHKIVPFCDLLSDAHEWFIKYTIDKYIIDGEATYNKFIKDHIDQRIRYIYECHLKYWSQTILPDPDKHSEDGLDQLEIVVYNYSSNISQHATIEDNYAEKDSKEKEIKLAKRIIELVINSNKYTDREKKIFNEVIYGANGKKTQDQISKELGVSRMRIVQIMRKLKAKLKTDMENDDEFWRLISQTDIDFDKINW